MLLAFGRQQSPEPENLVVTVEGRGIRVRLKRNARAKRYSLRVPTSGGDPVLTMPATGRFAEAMSFAEAHKSWLAARLMFRPDPVAFEHLDRLDDAVG